VSVKLENRSLLGRLVDGFGEKARGLIGRAEKRVAGAVGAVGSTANQVTDSLDVVAKGVGKLIDANVRPSLHVHNDPKLPVPPDRGGIKVASFNVELGGRKYDAIEAQLKQMNPDVACLQEASPETARKLASALHMNVAILSDQKAVLSKYPIQSAREVQLPGDSLLGQLAAWKRSGSPEAMEPRRVLETRIQVGDRSIDVWDTHLSLHDARSNALELERLGKLVGEAEQSGRTVVLAGDFNHNFGLARSGARADPAGTFATPTDTAAEFRDRYPASVPGNVGDPAAQQAAQRLLGQLQDFWSAPVRHVVVDGRAIDPASVAGELQQLAEVPSRSAAQQRRFEQLKDAFDGNSHLTANKRFDNILSTRNVRIASALIDQTAHASDHQAVLAEIRWD